MLEEIQNLDLRELLKEAKRKECYEAYLKFFNLESEILRYVSPFFDINEIKLTEMFMETVAVKMKIVAQTEEEKKLAEDYSTLYIILLYQRKKLEEILNQLNFEEQNKMNLYKKIILQLYGGFENFKEVRKFTISVIERLLEFGRDSKLMNYHIKGALNFEKRYYREVSKLVFGKEIL